ncbi:MAG: hypothetical protein BJ554DRAFT_1373 [Olpidium bornovanus]|uniref:Uncharacterized protein n=1 Tax=Olpidium bornovanus TaxID=278681 RepID=A0A8H7ZSU3_9FUNG|nr:MAG: hypothetical protein BJ554DRAFT_1373 [Olpidium bornovanus]
MASPAATLAPSAGERRPPPPAPQQHQQQQQQHVHSPVEVAWMFVKRYYTFVNKDPGTLHNFYGAKSVMIHGVEGEATDQCYGQQGIHQKYLDLKFEDCRVLVTNVDSSPSLEGSIFIQVLGELTNRGEPAHKFAQSFLLAKQANGYYVLNDIFRYLKDEVDSEYEGEDEAEENVKSTAIPEPAKPLPFEREQVVSEPEMRALTPPPQPPSYKRDVMQQTESVPAVYAGNTRSSTPEVHGAEAAEVPSVNQQEELEMNYPAEVPAVSRPPALERSPTPDVAVPAKHSVGPSASAEAKPSAQPALAPATPSTWAGIVGHEANKWKKDTVMSDVNSCGKAKAQPAPAPAPRPAAPQAPPPHAHAAARNDAPHPPPSSGGTNGTRDAREKSRSYAPNASIYVKNVPADTTLAMIRSAFVAFGEVLHCEFNQYKTGAFVDFATVDAAMKALKQREVTLPSGAVVISEEKRPRGPRLGGRGGYSGGRGSGYHGDQGSSSARGGRGRGRPRGDSKPPRTAQPPASVAAK